MFRLFNEDPYSMSNNIRLGSQLNNKNIHMTHASLESKILAKNSIGNKHNDEDSYEKLQIIDLNTINLQRFQYNRPKISIFLDHITSEKTSLVFEPPYEQWLYLSVRGIFDSKYTEMLILSDSLSNVKATRFVGKNHNISKFFRFCLLMAWQLLC